jgi:hypothetical protein
MVHEVLTNFQPGAVCLDREVKQGARMEHGRRLKIWQATAKSNELANRAFKVENSID